jgi:iron complex outermembrane recepter protein
MFKRRAIAAAAYAAVAGLPLVPAVTQAQQTNPQLQRVEITGSAVKRTIDQETALPVAIISREEIVRSGATTAAELLERITANSGQGYNQSLALGDGARPGFAGASLRGLGSNTTLVLLNGRRLAVYAFEGDGTDLNSIALGAIERVEILKDGASAIYGTDAIAGVINFITRRDYTGIDATIGLRSPAKSGGGASQHGSVTLGFGDIAQSRFNVFGNLSFDKYERLPASARSFSKTSFLPNAEGGRIDRTSGNTFPASIVVPGVGTINPGVPDCAPPTSFRTSATSACRFDFTSTIDMVPPQEKVAGLGRATFALTPSHELFAEYNRTQVTTKFAISPTPASSATTFNGDPVLYPAGGPNYPTAINPATGVREPGVLWYAADGSLTRFVPLTGDLNLAWRTTSAGPRTNQAKAIQDRVVLGGKGTIANAWDYDVGFMRSTSRVTESYIDGWLSESKLLNSTGGLPTDAGYTAGTLNPAINPFGAQSAAGQAAIDAAKVLAPTRISRSQREGVDGKITGELMSLPAGAVSVALGGEVRRETFSDIPLEILNGGDIIGGGGNQLPVNGSRRVSALFGELVVPITKSVEALAQVRTDRYSDVGNTTNPKVGIRWQPMREVLVRGSWGTGFRAPTLSNIFAPNTQTNTGGSYNDPYYEARVGDCYDAGGNPTANFNPQFCNAQLTVLQGGNRNLKPESSKQSNIGLVLQPTKDMTISIDLWRIRQKDGIAIPDADARLEDFLAGLVADPSVAYDPTTAKLSTGARAALNANTASGAGISRSAAGNLGPVSIQFDNISIVETRGVDVAVSALLARTSVGEFRAATEGTYMAYWKQDGTDFVAQFLQFGPLPRWKQKTTVEWSQSGWLAGLTFNYQSGYEDQGATRKVAAYETFDLFGSYSGVRNLKVNVGVRNLLDRDPPFSRQNAYFQVGWDPTYADPRGRTYTMSLNYQFK